MNKSSVADLKRAVKRGEPFHNGQSIGEQSQLVVMAIAPGGEIGLETHHEIDQVLYVLEGGGTAVVGDNRFAFKKGCVICVPAGAEHNVLNDGDVALKLYTVYLPLRHQPEAIDRFKAAEARRA